MSTTKSEYTQLCTEILDAVGGSKNIKNVFHCITRLRIVPVNRDAVDMDKLSKVSGILKVVESSGQIQCVIGTTVPEVYEEFLAMSGVAAGSLLLIPMACSLFGISNDIAMQVVGVGFIIGVVQDSVETALNSAGDVEFAATAEYHQWRKEGKPLPAFLCK